MPVTNLGSATWFSWVPGFSFFPCCRRTSCRMLEPTCRSHPPRKPGSKTDALALSCPVPTEPLTSLLRDVRLRADGALTNTDYTKSSSLVLPLYDGLYYCSCALASEFQWFFHNTLNPFPAHCSEWLVPCPHIKLCYVFLQQTALYCITSWYLPSAGPISLTSQTILSKRHFSLVFILPPMKYSL